MHDTPNTVDVLLTGNTLPNADIDQAAAAFAKMTGIDPAQARALITGGKSKLLWRGLSPEKGLVVTSRFTLMGIEAIMRPSASAASSKQEAPQRLAAPNVTQPQQEAQSKQTPPRHAQLGASFCTNCGNAVAAQAVACTNCGFPPRLERKFCHNCGVAIDARQVMCVKCGISFASQVVAEKSPAKTKASHPATEAQEYAVPNGAPMTFGNAVKTCLKKFANFSGRASRAEFWFFHLFDWLLCLGGFVLMCLLAPVAQRGGLAGSLAILADSVIIIAAFVLALPCFAVAARRLHDTDRSGWLLLLNLVPLGPIALFVWFLYEGTPGPNRFGDAPGTTSSNVYTLSEPSNTYSPPQSNKGDAATAQTTSDRVPTIPRPRRKAMSFTDAMKSCFKKYAVFSGRASRAEFWYFVLVCYLIGLCFCFFISFIQMSTSLYGENFEQFFIIIFVLLPFYIVLPGFIWSIYILVDTFAGSTKIYMITLTIILFIQWIPGISVATRRLHDIDKSGWSLLLGAIPFLGPILLFVFFLRKGTEEDNRFGEAPGTMSPNKES